MTFNFLNSFFSKPAVWEHCSPDYKLIGLRQRNGFTQQEAAQYLRVSWYGFYDYEVGRKEPTPEIWHLRLQARLGWFSGETL